MRVMLYGISSTRIRRPQATIALGPRKTCALTGSTGFLGSHVVQILLEEGQVVKALVRPGSEDRLHNLSKAFPDTLQLVIGSLDDVSALEALCSDADVLFHLAGKVRHTRRKCEREQLMEVNVNGTRRILEAAVTSGVKRVVYASTSGTVGVTARGDWIPDDGSNFSSIAKSWPYYNSKIQAEKVASRIAQENSIELVMMRPSLLLGPGDVNLSSCKVVLDFLKQKIPFIPNGGVSFVDVRDAAKAFANAMNSTVASGNYLLGGVNMTTEDFFKNLEVVSGTPAPKLKLPNWLGRILASFALILKLLFTRTYDEGLDPVLVEMSQHFWYISSSSAIRSLNFRPTDQAGTLKDTVNWVSKSHL